MAYDVEREVVALTGGANAEGFLADHWEWDGTSWSEVEPNGGVPECVALAWTGTLTMVGLSGPDAEQLQVYDFVDQRWVVRDTAGESPTIRDGVGAAFEPTSSRLIVYGGLGEPADPQPAFDCYIPFLSQVPGESDEELGWLNETWSLQSGANHWKVLDDDCRTPRLAREGPLVFHDPPSGSVWLMGGVVSGEHVPNAWRLEGDGWVEMPDEIGSSVPLFSSEQAYAYDTTRDQLLATNGTTDQGRLDGVWAWRDARWRPVSSRLPPGMWRKAPAMAYDQARDQFVLFGGRRDGNEYPEDTWILAWEAESELGSDGCGCGG